MRTALTRFCEKSGNHKLKCPQDKNLRASKLAIKVHRNTDYHFMKTQNLGFRSICRAESFRLTMAACMFGRKCESEELAWILQKLGVRRLGVFKAKVAKPCH